MNTRLDGYEGNQTALREEVAKLREENATLAFRLAVVETGLASLREDVEHPEHAMARNVQKALGEEQRTGGIE